jgi:hypothetical protein
LETLRRARIVERIADGLWRVPDNLAARGLAYDRQRLGGSVVELLSHIPIERQVHVVGATWLDRQLVEGARGLSEHGFGSDVRQALNQRKDFLVAHGFAERIDARVVFGRKLLTILRNREIDEAVKRITAETGLTHQPLLDQDRVEGVYRRSVLLASGRFAMLDDGLGFSLVPWRPVIEKRLGQTIAAVVLGDHISWQFGRKHTRSL